MILYIIKFNYIIQYIDFNIRDFLIGGHERIARQGLITESVTFMPRKSLDHEGHPHANSPEVAPEGRFLPAGVIFGSLRV
ncbi:hypothetical protein AT281_29055 [Bacillus cereus]|nr:hypothetical protein IY08_30425 [Bacillus cereus]KXZ07902.1 hypothetical protein AT281_29020 [Bacillus cereus]KXZ07909.1 hypothetical protein AT281_29055 [Bacillus cereus]PET55153.1 hypothetical protein CN536_28945 [Bacillus cereus]